MRRRRARLARSRRSTTEGRADATVSGAESDDRELERRLLWILGAPPTGSTWLLEQLCDPLRLDNSTATGYRVPAGWQEPLDVLPVNEFLISSHIAPALGEPIERDHQLFPATLNNYLAHKPAYLFASEYEEVWRPAVRRLTLARLRGTVAAAEAEAPGATASAVLAIKEVNGSHAADLLMSLFPRSRMLFMVRDGRDVIDSRIHAVQEGGWLAEFEGAAWFRTPGGRLGWIRRAAREWSCSIDAARRAFESHQPELRHTIRYEDLLANTQESLSALFEWLGLRRDAARVQRLVAEHSLSAIAPDRRGRSRKRAATPGLWRASLSPAEQELTQETMGSRLASLGYPP